MVITVAPVTDARTLATPVTRHGSRSEIRLDRTPCYGTCPVYTLSLFCALSLFEVLIERIEQEGRTKDHP